MNRWTITTALILTLASPSAHPALAKTGAPPPETGVNRGVVELETGRAAGISVRVAEVLANVIDDGSTRRVLPVITKLYNEEFHLLARQDVKSVADLANQKVNVDLRGAGTAITAARLFEMLNIPVVATNGDQETALDRLRR